MNKPEGAIASAMPPNNQSNTVSMDGTPAMLADPREYVRNWLRMSDIKITGPGRLVNPDGRDKASTFQSMWLDYQSQVRAYNWRNENRKIAAFHKSDLADALDELIDLLRVGAIKETRERLACNGSENLAPLKAWLRAVCGHENELELRVMAHFIVQIKRKMHDREVWRHMMPILYGPQNAGKSTAVTKLVSPIAEWRTDRKIDALTDERNYHSLGTSFVCVADELQNATRADVDVAKNMITAEYLDYRRLTTHNVERVRQRTTFIGTTNRLVSTMFPDTTGMRRFYQAKTLVRVNFDALNSIDYVELWKGVDENRPGTYLDDVDLKLCEAQQELVTADEFEEFVSEFELEPVEGFKTDAIPASVMYGNYSKWCDLNGHKPVHATYLGKRLGGFGIQSKKAKVDGRVSRVYIVNEKALRLFEAARFLTIDLTGGSHG